MTKQVWILLVAVILMVSCEGPMGPAGPTGLTGPTGPTGAAGLDFQYFRASAVLNSEGGASIALPVGAGTSTKPILVNCYMGDGSGVWLLIGTDLSEGGVTSGLVWSTDHWVAALIGGVPGWIFYVVAAW